MYEGYSRYLISDEGIIKRLSTDSFTKTQLDSSGYSVVTLRGDNGVRRTFKVHRLVALLFVGNPYGKPEVNHKDGVKTNNHHHNLEWVTRSENIKHAWRTGLLRSTNTRSAKLSAAHSGKKIGSDNHRARAVLCITTNEVFSCIAEACRKYGIDQAGISKCCTIPPLQKSAGKHPETKESLKWSYYGIDAS
jgi:hypothetical protein